MFSLVVQCVFPNIWIEAEIFWLMLYIQVIPGIFGEHIRNVGMVFSIPL